MNRSELVDAIAERSGVTKSDVDASLKGLFEVVAGVVANILVAAFTLALLSAIDGVIA